DSGLCYRGYNADLGACGSLGEPSARAIREFEAIRAGIAATLAIVCEGVTGEALYTTLVGTVRESGFPEFRTNFAGHTIGLEAREIPFTFAPEVAYPAPFLPPTSELPLPAGAVVNIEAPIGRMGHGGYQFESSVVVTPDGYRPLVAQNQ